MEHISLDKVFSYIESQIKGKETDEIEAHIATCEKCHGIYISLMSFENPLSRSFDKETATTSCPEDWEVGALIKGELPSDISHKISSHVKDCAFCIERAVAYCKALELKEKVIETPELWKQKAFPTLKGKETEVSISKQISAFFQRLTAPLPPLPGYATAVIAILILIIWNVIPQKEKIITIASSERIITRDSEIPSTFGFMGAGESKEVENMEISHAGRNIVFKWETIEGAVGYDFSIKERTNSVYSTNTGKHSEVSLNKGLLKKERLYSWLITGKTIDGKYFEYTGDFVLVK